MQLLINIPDEKYNKINSDLYATFPADMKEWGLEAIKNGTPVGNDNRWTNKEWIDFLSKHFDVSRTSAKTMLHLLMCIKYEYNFKKMFNGRQVF